MTILEDIFGLNTTTKEREKIMWPTSFTAAKNPPDKNAGHLYYINRIFFSAKTIHSAFGRKRDLQALLWNDGHIFAVFGEHMVTLCSLDMTYYPFDRQYCKIRIGTWMSVDRFVRLR